MQQDLSPYSPHNIFNISPGELAFVVNNVIREVGCLGHGLHVIRSPKCRLSAGFRGRGTTPHP
jgi:hypothetical protein